MFEERTWKGLDNSNNLYCNCSAKELERFSKIRAVEHMPSLIEIPERGLLYEAEIKKVYAFKNYWPTKVYNVISISEFLMRIIAHERNIKCRTRCNP